jgi:F-type H+-transporting ATPase subunit alpha
MKKVAGRLKLDLAQYRALSAFVQFATDLDPKTRDQIDQGAKMVELLKQPQFDPVPVEEQIAIIWAGTSGILKDVSVGLMIRFEKDYRDYLRKHAGGILTKLKNEGKMTDEISNKLKVATEKFLELWPVLKESKQE